MSTIKTRSHFYGSFPRKLILIFENITFLLKPVVVGIHEIIFVLHKYWNAIYMDILYVFCSHFTNCCYSDFKYLGFFIHFLSIIHNCYSTFKCVCAITMTKTLYPKSTFTTIYDFTFTYISTGAWLRFQSVSDESLSRAFTKDFWQRATDWNLSQASITLPFTTIFTTIIVH